MRARLHDKGITYHGYAWSAYSHWSGLRAIINIAYRKVAVVMAILSLMPWATCAVQAMTRNILELNCMLLILLQFHLECEYWWSVLVHTSFTAHSAASFLSNSYSASYRKHNWKFITTRVNTSNVQNTQHHCLILNNSYIPYSRKKGNLHTLIYLYT